MSPHHFSFNPFQNKASVRTHLSILGKAVLIIPVFLTILLGVGICAAPLLKADATAPNVNNAAAPFYNRPTMITPPGADFTLIALPDTEKASASYPQVFRSQTQWISDHQARENIIFVTHLGDIVNVGNDLAQWHHADDAFDLLDLAEIPYSVGPGNHDLGLLWKILPGPTHYNTYLGTSRFVEKGWYGGHYGKDNFNNYSLFSASGLDFILINLQYNPTTAMLDWADTLLKTNPERRGIIVSHNVILPNNAWSNQGIYTALQDNPNLSLILCGHNHNGSDGAAQRTEMGPSGNPIYILMSDYQEYLIGGSGYLRIMRFSPTNNTISVRTYSPYISNYLTDPENQFTLAYPMTDRASSK